MQGATSSGSMAHWNWLGRREQAMPDFNLLFNAYRSCESFLTVAMTVAAKCSRTSTHYEVWKYC